MYAKHAKELSPCVAVAGNCVEAEQENGRAGDRLSYS